jgi:hypothetical protein
LCIGGVCLRDRSIDPLRALLVRHRQQQRPNPAARWADLPPIEGLPDDDERPGWGGMVQDGAGWREG